MFRTTMAACVAACAMLGAAGSADAAALVYAGSGRFIGDFEGSPVNRAISFQVMHFVDPANVGFDTISQQSYYRGGSSFGLQTLSSGDLLLDDMHIHFTADYYSQVLQDDDATFFTAGKPGLFEVSIGTNFASGSLMPDITSPPSGNLCLIAISCGGTIHLLGINGGLDLTDLTVTYYPLGGNTAAPEPTTWALMIAGFGGAGAMLRRRRPAVS